MAKAVRKEEVQTKVSVELALTESETKFLRAFLGSVVIGGGEGRYLADDIYRALGEAGYEKMYHFHTTVDVSSYKEGKLYDL